MSKKQGKSFSLKRLFTNFLTLALVVASVTLISGSIKEWSKITNQKTISRASD